MLLNRYWSCVSEYLDSAMDKIRKINALVEDGHYCFLLDIRKVALKKNDLITDIIKFNIMEANAININLDTYLVEVCHVLNAKNIQHIEGVYNDYMIKKVMA